MAFIGGSAGEDDKPDSKRVSFGTLSRGDDGWGVVLGCGTWTGLASGMGGGETTLSSGRGRSGSDRVGGGKVFGDGSSAAACSLVGTESSTKTSSEDRGGGEAGRWITRTPTRT